MQVRSISQRIYCLLLQTVAKCELWLTDKANFDGWHSGYYVLCTTTFFHNLHWPHQQYDAKQTWWYGVTPCCSRACCDHTYLPPGWGQANEMQNQNIGKGNKRHAVSELMGTYYKTNRTNWSGRRHYMLYWIWWCTVLNLILWNLHDIYLKFALHWICMDLIMLLNLCEFDRALV